MKKTKDNLIKTMYFLNKQEIRNRFSNEKTGAVQSVITVGHKMESYFCIHCGADINRAVNQQNS